MTVLSVSLLVCAPQRKVRVLVNFKVQVAIEVVVEEKVEVEIEVGVEAQNKYCND